MCRPVTKSQTFKIQPVTQQNVEKVWKYFLKALSPSPPYLFHPLSPCIDGSLSIHQFIINLLSSMAGSRGGLSVAGVPQDAAAVVGYSAQQCSPVSPPPDSAATATTTATTATDTCSCGTGSTETHVCVG